MQEMCRAEKLTEQAAVQAEIDTYAELLPGPLEISATLSVEIPDQVVARRELDRLTGLDERVFLVVGDRAPVKATFEAGHRTRERFAAYSTFVFLSTRGRERPSSTRLFPYASGSITPSCGQKQECRVTYASPWHGI